MDFRVLGPVEVLQDGRRIDVGRRRERAMLGVLLLEANHLVPNERLTSLLWAGSAPENARRHLAVHASRIRAGLAEVDDVRVDGGSDGYRLEVDPDRVDVHRFRRAIERVHETGSADERITLLEEALALWRGPLMADSLDPEARERLAVGLQESRLIAQEMLTEAKLQTSASAPSLLPEILDLVHGYPLRATGHRLLMTALHQTGRSAEALKHYQ